MAADRPGWGRRSARTSGQVEQMGQRAEREGGTDDPFVDGISSASRGAMLPVRARSGASDSTRGQVMRRTPEMDEL
jgi:hypothetical protein